MFALAKRFLSIIAVGYLSVCPAFAESESLSFAGRINLWRTQCDEIEDKRKLAEIDSSQYWQLTGELGMLSSKLSELECRAGERRAGLIRSRVAEKLLTDVISKASNLQSNDKHGYLSSALASLAVCKFTQGHFSRGERLLLAAINAERRAIALNPERNTHDWLVGGEWFGGNLEALLVQLHVAYQETGLRRKVRKTSEEIVDLYQSGGTERWRGRLTSKVLLSGDYLKEGNLAMAAKTIQEAKVDWLNLLREPVVKTEEAHTHWLNVGSSIFHAAAVVSMELGDEHQTIQNKGLKQFLDGLDDMRTTRSTPLPSQNRDTFAQKLIALANFLSDSGCSAEATVIATILYEMRDAEHAQDLEILRKRLNLAPVQ